MTLKKDIPKEVKEVIITGIRALEAQISSNESSLSKGLKKDSSEVLTQKQAIDLVLVNERMKDQVNIAQDYIQPSYTGIR